MKKAVSAVIPHLCIILSCTVLTLLVIDKFNTQMNFIDNEITKGIMIVLTLLTVICSVMLILRQYSDDSANR